MTDRNGHRAHDGLFIVLGSDDRYALPMAVTLHSALTHIPDSIKVRALIVDAGIEEPNRQRIERAARRAHRNAELRWVAPEMAQFEGLRTTHWGSPASYLPLLIPGLVDDASRVLYLDSDLLIKANLHDLWQMSVRGDKLLHAVTDYGFATVGEALKDDAASRLGLDGDAPYFNSGVLMIDLDAWRDQRIAEQALHFAREHPEVMRFTDQDALNAVIQGDWEPLDPRWNVLVGSIDRLVERLDEDGVSATKVRDELTTTPFILHFSGQQKPWKPGYTRMGQTDYLHSVRDSGWFDTKIELWGWRLRLALLTPLIKTRRRIVGWLWPTVVSIRQARSREKAGAPK